MFSTSIVSLQVRVAFSILSCPLGYCTLGSFFVRWDSSDLHTMREIWRLRRQTTVHAIVVRKPSRCIPALPTTRREFQFWYHNFVQPQMTISRQYSFTCWIENKKADVTEYEARLETSSEVAGSLVGRACSGLHKNVLRMREAFLALGRKCMSSHRRTPLSAQSSIYNNTSCVKTQDPHLRSKQIVSKATYMARLLGKYNADKSKSMLLTSVTARHIRKQ